jgi:acetyl esterase/lipase
MTNPPTAATGGGTSNRARTGIHTAGMLLTAFMLVAATGFWRGDLNVAPPAPVPTMPSTDQAGPADAAAFRLVPPTTAPATPATATPTTSGPTTTAPAPGLPVLVPDPRPGDLRIDDSADILPVGYHPGPAATTTRDIAYGTDPAQRLDLYLPDNAGAPILLYLHSGGWIGGDKSAVPDMVMRFVERGYAVASVEYSLAPDTIFPGAVTDVKLAIRWLKAYAEAEGTLDGERIVLVGASSGGHLAAFTAATPGEYEPTGLTAELAAFDSTVVGIVSFVGPTDLVQLYDQPHVWARGITSAFVGCFPCDAAQLAEPSVGEHLHPGLPPAYWAYGTDDPLIDADSQAVAIAEAWAAVGGAESSWLDLVDGAEHTLDESTVNQRALETFVDDAVGIE